MWDDSVKHLKEDYTCICVDLPGFGQSPVQVDISMSQIAEQLHKSLASMDMQSYVLLGHSMGGYVALEFASMFPDKLDGLGLLHSTANPDSIENTEGREKTIAFLDQADLETYGKLFAPNLFAPQHRENARWVKDAQDMVGQSSNKALQEAMKAMIRRKDHNALLRQLDVPVFFLVGRHDAMVPMNDMLKQAASCKQSMTCLLNDAGHLAMVENPVKYKQAVNDYLLWVYRKK